MSYDRLPMTESMTYKDIVADLVPNSVAGARVSKLPIRDWAPLIPSVNYQGFKGNTFKFFVESGANGWNTYFRFDEFYEQVDDTSITAPEAARLLLWAGNLRMHCNCPSFTYHGFAYILTSLDAEIYPETRFPAKNNPELLGWGCKHLRKAARVLPFHLGHFASAIKATRQGRTTDLDEPVEILD